MNKFKTYSAEDAEKIAETFLAATKKIQPERADTELWTEWVLDWFAASASTSAAVDARSSRCGEGRNGGWPLSTLQAFHPDWKTPRATGGEFLVDLCHTSFPDYNHWGTPEYWQQAFKTSNKPPEILLALESEFGSSANDKLNLHRVMEDASKLLVLCARVKVMLFASTTVASRDEILDLAKKMVTHDRSGATWVWIDLPWADTWEKHGPTSKILRVPTA